MKSVAQLHELTVSTQVGCVGVTKAASLYVQTQLHILISFP